MKLSIAAGSTSETVELFIQDSSKTDGSGLAGLAYNTAGLTAYYSFPRGSATAITLATLASATAAYSSGGFKEIDATNKPGSYRLDIPNACLAAGGGRYCNIMLKGAANMAPVLLEIELTAWNNQGVRCALAQAGNANSITLDASASGTNNLYNGQLVCLSAGTGAGQARAITGYNGTTKVATVDRPWQTAPASGTTFALLAADAPALNPSLQVTASVARTVIRSGTAQAGSTTTTIKLDAGASATDNLYAGNLIALTGGTGLGQSRTVVSYGGTTKVATVDRAWATTPDGTTTFDLYASTTASLFSDQGVAQAGGSTSITLAATASAVNSVYVGSIVTILSGTGSGQTREITGYVGATKVATVDSAWSSNPDATSAYAVIPAAAADVAAVGPTATQIVAAIDEAAPHVTLADGAAHGGTPGSSTATLAAKRLALANDTSDPAFYVGNSAGTATEFESTGGDGRGLFLVGHGGGTGLRVYGGDTGRGMDVFGGNTSGDAVGFFAGGAGHGLVLYSAGDIFSALSIDASDAPGANAIEILGGDAENITPAGAGVAIATADGHGIAIAAGPGHAPLLLNDLDARKALLAVRYGYVIDGTTLKVLDQTLNPAAPEETYTITTSAEGHILSVIWDD